MEPNQLIDAFINVIQKQDYVFDSEAIQDIPSLQNDLTELENSGNLSLENLAEVIRKWYINHGSVRDAVLVTEREIDKVKKSNPANQETTLENRCRIIKEESGKLEEKDKEKNKEKNKESDQKP